MEREYEELDRRIRRREEERKRRKKRRNSILIIAAVLAVVLVIAVPIFSGPGLAPEETVTVTVPAGSDTLEIAKLLKENKVISNRLWFLLSLRQSEYYGKLRYGTFTFSGDMNTKEIIRTLALEGAQKETVTVTIPEGYSVERIVARCTEEGLASTEEFEKALQGEYGFAFLKEIPEKKGQKYRLQGFLFPSTYEFYLTASAEDVVRTMLAEFEKQYLTVFDDFSDLYDIVTKASLVERESKIESENAIIAGVIENRLKKGMRLQIDATVVYAITDGQYDVTRVLHRDLETDSPYNTYANAGLPVGPICNPGAAAITGVKNAQSHNYLYYHTDETKKDGSHIFTETFSEHTATMN